MLDLQKITNDWTLFLDRDGVLNHEKENDYVLNTLEFVMYENSITAIPILNQLFNRIIVTTNQKGIGKQLMTEDDLSEIHALMLNKIAEVGGKLDHIYYCTDLDDNSPNRKPQPGMAFKAKQAFPDIDLSKSIMVGNRISDMKFGRNAGMYTVFVATTHPETPFPDPHIDLRFPDLHSFALACATVKKSTK